MGVDERRFASQKRTMLTGVLVLLSFLVLPAMAQERFINNGDGTVTDIKTDLMWAAEDNGIPINWMDAQLFCQEYGGGGYTDWRMPTLDELSSLYAPKEKNTRGYRITKLIKITASSLWASEKLDGKAGRFNFTYGTIYWLRQPYSGPTRILPVRNLN